MVGVLFAIVTQAVGVSAYVDRDQATLGEVVTLTIQVRATSATPVQIVDPMLSGFALRSSREQTHVSLEGNTATRLTIREIALVPSRPGTATIGAIIVHVGDSTVTTDPISVAVSASNAARSAGLDERVAVFVRERAPPALSEDQVAVELRALRDSISLGEQLDVVVIAWFPRPLRSRLRTPPQLQPPQIRGAWGYEQGGPPATALGRRVGGRWYDLYVHHQVLFPLRSGALTVEPATVTYNLPVTFSFLSRELRHEVPSESLSIHVAPQPNAGRPAGFEGAAASDLSFDVTATPTELAVGEASVVAVTLAGRGNVALWPEPALDWPPGVRWYPEDTEITVAPQDGLIGGTKTFRYLVVSDMPGTHRVGTPSYPYFDLAGRRYATLRARTVELVTRAGVSARVSPPAAGRELLSVRPWLSADRLAATVPPWGWALLLLVPPFAAAAALLGPKVQARRRRRAGDHPATEWDAAKHEFRDTLEGLVPQAHLRTDTELADALRAAGLEPPVAEHAARVRTRLWQSRYGPDSDIDSTELVAEVHALVRAMVGETRHRSASRAFLVTTLACTALAVPALEAQAPERLYEAGVMRAAADSFAARAAVQPWVAAHWHNLGAALDGAGDATHARAAWTRAARLEPRARSIRDALRSSGTADPLSGPLTWVSPVTPGEALLAAALLWILGWGLVAMRVSRRYGLGVLAIAVASATYGAYVSRRYARPVAFALASETPLRVAPYGSAPTLLSLNSGSAVAIVRAEGSWLLVRRVDQVGWLRRREIVAL